MNKAAPLHEYLSENEVDDEHCQNLARCLSTSLPGDQLRSSTRKKQKTKPWKVREALHAPMQAGVPAKKWRKRKVKEIMNGQWMERRNDDQLKKK